MNGGGKSGLRDRPENRKLTPLRTIRFHLCVAVLLARFGGKGGGEDFLGTFWSPFWRVNPLLPGVFGYFWRFILFCSVLLLFFGDLYSFGVVFVVIC